MLSIWLSVLIVIARISYIKKVSGIQFIILVIILLIVLIICFTSTDLITFYIIFETSLIPILLLLIGWGYQPERIRAGIYMLFYTLTASMPLLITLIHLSTSIDLNIILIVSSQNN